VVYGFRWEDPEGATPSPEVRAALAQADLIVICPSNPFVSVDPILAMPGVREALSARPTVAVSPILGGDVVKGPAAKMFRELGTTPSALAVAAYYQDLLDGFVLDAVDVELLSEVEALDMAARAVQTLMIDPAKRPQVARDVLAFATSLL
jgi:LPPG:FO 2-phospho-L-lactate transferase